jgi:hypothetical protein
MFLPLVGFAQESERVIERVPWRTEPIKVLKLRTKNKEVEPGKKFSEADDWLVGLTATVQNTSNKAIARIELTLAFPPPKGSSPEKPTLVVPMTYGKEPASVSPSEDLKLILPGESVEIKLRESNLPGIKEDLEKLGYGQTAKHAQIFVDSATFVDGSEWRGDEILYPNPNNPKQKINPMRQLPDVSKPPKERSGLPGNSPVFRFLNAGFTRPYSPLYSPPRFEKTNNYLGRVSFPQLPGTQPCNAIFIEHYTNTRGPVGEGCSYQGDLLLTTPLRATSGSLTQEPW